MDHLAKRLLVLVYVNEEELTETLRRVLRDARTSGFRKVIVNVLSQLPHWQVLANSREAILDNIELGLEIYTVNPEEVASFLERKKYYEADGLSLYCDEGHKYQLNKIIGTLPDSVKVNIVKNSCK
ncbi:MAG: DUF5751 family protein [Metallosphaera yellowstonensis]|jgi:hypothetical protein|uniref:DUF5751 domain-containing protein n=1 Tax=Metallosphaera yellowstonensis MK1 TaxID=671065 RepID=H2C373_9CREN|nr:DUF5751 family protein [Metallosphaera yellowstonensis]EHP70694.1 hypothetical protein MetMK1DRAFT_00011970 [Metallosphaera yellowstonensis MK1]